MTIEARFDIPLIAGLALREKQIQQNYRKAAEPIEPAAANTAEDKPKGAKT